MTPGLLDYEKMAMTSSLLRANRVLLLAPRLTGRTSCLPCCSRTPAMLASTKLHTSPHRSSDGPGGMMGSTHWNLERGLTVAMIGIIPAALIAQHPALDYALAASLVLHGHWGVEHVITDYVHGKTLPKVAHSILFAVSALAFAGFCNFNYNDVGLSKAIAMLWS